MASAKEPETTTDVTTDVVQKQNESLPTPSGPPATTPSVSETTASAAAPAPAHEDRKAAMLTELEKRRARAMRFGEATDDLDKKIQRIQKFGLESSEDAGVQRIDSELKGSKRAREEAKKPIEKKQATAPAPAPALVDVRNGHLPAANNNRRKSLRAASAALSALAPCLKTPRRRV